MSRHRDLTTARQSERLLAEMPSPLILASASPRREMLLGELGLPFQIIASNEAETADPGRRPEEQAALLAERKARAVAKGLTGGQVLGADTIVILDGEILGKPFDDGEAVGMLRRLSGRSHEVVTGLSLVDAATGECRTASVVSTVHMRSLTEEDIASYVATGEPRDKAGAYGIQGLAGALIEKLAGCLNNVVGLPLCAVASLLTEADVPVPPGWSGCRLPDGSLCPNSFRSTATG